MPASSETWTVGPGHNNLPTVTDGRLPDPLRCAGANPLASGPDDLWRQWWNYACASAQRYARGVEPPEIELWGPVLDDNEAVVLSADIVCSRLFGGDGRYDTTTWIALGRPALLVGSVVASAAVNRHRKVAARRDAVPRWRDARTTRVIATSFRVMCSTPLGWDSFPYDVVTDFHPDLERWSLTMGFGTDQLPLRLVGPPAPALCLWTATAVLGDRWVDDPRLAALLN
ncbi:hypothetical protein FHT44_006181 [Mycolicibacterium sp. BK634]|uniref:hypothetical protein n=1 Tax=Mycolicibacterium sp. BK634 TaxID=2587099 RepID=UPI00179BC6D8|nr:hypothetical protein [Mycolicibacterium sp. BK634]MBB3753659.1 hypothetical protein [Mycolicibacterium sp. BK634]